MRSNGGNRKYKTSPPRVRNGKCTQRLSFPLSSRSGGKVFGAVE